jgi:hypothetical protein
MNTDVVYQFRITLLGIEPPIWRRIQVRDCSLDDLHFHIQMAMGWSNLHLYEFKIKGQGYAAPELMEESFEEFELADSMTTAISQVVPQGRRRLTFKYRYDFGDDWEHKVAFEGSLPADEKQKYPVCLEGERACPPEDIGGVWGYEDFLDAISDPDHQSHEEYKNLARVFDPEKFDPEQATKAMREGLSGWSPM